MVQKRHLALLILFQLLVVLSTFYMGSDHTVFAADRTQEGGIDSVSLTADSVGGCQSIFADVDERSASRPEMFGWLLTIATVLPALVLMLISIIVSGHPRLNVWMSWGKGHRVGPGPFSAPYVIATTLFLAFILIGIGLLNHVWRLFCSSGFDTTVIYGSLGLSLVSVAYLGGLIFYVLAWQPLLIERERGKLRHVLGSAGDGPASNSARNGGGGAVDGGSGQNPG